MCGRYYIADEDAAEELKQIIDEVNRKYNGSGLNIKCAGDIFPTDVAPVIAGDYEKSRDVCVMRWGYSLSNGKVSFNARSENAATSMYRHGLNNCRCLVPATNYFEWRDGVQPKPLYDIRPASGKMMYMAGVYRNEGKRRVFSILTRNAANEIRFVHERMPIILPGDIAYDWLNVRYAAMDILRHADLNMAAKPVGPEQLSMNMFF